MSKSWFNYYKNHKTITLSNLFLHWFYLINILLSRPKKILEIGCGPADHSIFLKNLIPFSKISLLDSDKRIINRLKKKLIKKIDNFYFCDLLKKEDINKKVGKQKFDIIYSQGLMEHFKDEDFIKIIKNLLPYSKKMLHSIPSEFYPTKDFGNEILRNRQELKKLLRQLKIINFSISKYTPDIGLKTKIVRIKKFNLGFFDSVFFLLFGSCHYLIKISKKETTF